MLIEVEFKPAAGEHPDDQTCFLAEYEHNGPERQNWPRILYQYKPDDNLPATVKPGNLLTSEGYVVLSNDNEPILDFPSIPLTISSMCEGWRLEAFYRSNKWVTLKQLRSRMPGGISMRLGNLSMRMTRFRRKAGAIAWDATGEASDAFEAYMDQKLPPACKAANSIQAFRSLYPHEIAEMELRSVGRFPMRARGNKDDSAEKLQRMRDAALEKYNKLLARFNAENGHEACQNDAAEENSQNEEESDEDSHSSGNLDIEVDDPSDNGDGAGSGDQWSNSQHEPLSNSASRHDQDEPEDQSLGNEADDSNGTEGSSEEKSRAEEDVDGAEINNPANGSDLDFLETNEPKVGNFLYEDPTTVAEAELITHLLEPTVRQYLSLTGLTPPATDPERSYVNQWGDIATSFSEAWAQHEPDRPVDLLIGLSVYTPYTTQWNQPWDEDRFGPSLTREPQDAAVFAERALRNRQQW